MQIIDTIALISINETLVAVLLSFLIFLFIVNRVMFRPLRNVINERELYINNIKEDIAGARKKYEEILFQIKDKEKKIKEAASSEKRKLEESGAKEAGAILGSARQDILSMKKEAENRTQEQLLHARKSIGAESKILSVAIMEKILDRRLS